MTTRQSSAPRKPLNLEHTPTDLVVPIEGLAPCTVLLKLEGMNAAGSIKLKTAVQILDDLEISQQIAPGARLIESSSGNLGVAIAMLSAARGYHFTCVTDPNASALAVGKMKALGADVICVTTRDETCNYLKTRLSLIKRMCEDDPDLVWLNQYGNPSNWRAHYFTTAPEILSVCPNVEYLFVGAGTTGTVMGCARYFRQYAPSVVIVAVDALGSVTFGSPPGRRHIPGIGASHKPEIADASLVDELVLVDEREAILMCRALAARGLPIGGSTGSVLSAVSRMSHRFRPGTAVVAISPDMGDKYLDTIYDDGWVKQHYPEVLLQGLTDQERSISRSASTRERIQIEGNTP